MMSQRFPDLIAGFADCLSARLEHLKGKLTKFCLSTVYQRANRWPICSGG